MVQKALYAQIGHLQRNAPVRAVLFHQFLLFLSSLPLHFTSGSFVSQHLPGGIGLPCGQVFGWPRKVQMR